MQYIILTVQDRAIEAPVYHGLKCHFRPRTLYMYNVIQWIEQFNEVSFVNIFSVDSSDVEVIRDGKYLDLRPF